MTIHEKIEEIRQKPEHIRLRYAWALTFLITAIIALIWFFTLANRKDESKDSSDQSGDVINQLKEDVSSMQDAAGEVKKSFDATSEIQIQKELEGSR